MTEKAEILALYKNLGETPLECLIRYKTEHPAYREVKMTYLGRLDPMAEGLLPVLAGDVRDKASYLALDKTYEFEVLWGFKSDTHDILGLAQASGKFPHKLERSMPSLVKKIQGKKTQVYPLFSSRSFSGNFMKAREEKIEEFDRPEKQIRIFSLEHIHTRVIVGREILEEVTWRLASVRGDFRQEKILSAWRNLLMPLPNEAYLISRFRADVSSGTYIRGLADDMGEMIGCKAVAWSIKRTRVGEWKVENV